jgi:hypothetical protein
MLSDILTAGLYDLPWSRIAIFTALFFLLERIATITLLYASRPRNMKIAGLPLWPGKWLSELDFILNGADRLVQRANELGPGVFAMPALSTYQVLVSSPSQIQEFTKAGEDIMSFRAAMNEVRPFTYPNSLLKSVR